MAVGSVNDSNGFTRTLAERWNGSRWSVEPTPAAGPSGPNGSALQSISCVSSNDCVAVGYFAPYGGFNAPLAEHWDGAHWRLTKLPSTPDGSPLAAVSCAARTRCLAVGYNDDIGQAMLDVWNGSSWTSGPLPSGPGGPSTNPLAIDCLSEQFCIVMGDFFDATDSVERMFSDTWNGASWTSMTLPQPATAIDVTPLSVACTASTSCTAVGRWLTSYSSPYHAISEQWNGAAWTIDTPSVPRMATGDQLAAVTCVQQDCTAVGNYQTADPPAMNTLIERRTPTGWQFDPTPTLPGAVDSLLRSVTCSSTDACLAVGSWGFGTRRPLVESWNGKRWALLPTPGTASTVPVDLEGVACPSPTQCIAVGAVESTDANPGHAFAAAWNGSVWRTMPLPPLTVGSNDALQSVSCPSTTMCMAVGSYAGSRGFPTPLAERWANGRWTIQSLPSDPKKIGQLWGVSCPSPGTCVAVGMTGSAALAEVWQQGHWTLSSAPPPPGGSAGTLNAVSCPSVAMCVAVGNIDLHGSSLGLSEIWNGHSWQPGRVPAVDDMLGVSCPTTTSCTATGFDFNATLGRAAAAEWNGRSWIKQQVQLPARSTSSSLLSVSCSDVRGCTAVGSRNRGASYTGLPLAEQR